jgi:ankyrin repeat protein
VVRTLLAAGANIHEVNSRGLSGICWANRFGHQDIVQLTLESGVDRWRIEDGEITIPSRGAASKNSSRDEGYMLTARSEQVARRMERQQRNPVWEGFEAEYGVSPYDPTVGLGLLAAVDPHSDPHLPRGAATSSPAHGHEVRDPRSDRTT